MQSEGEIIFISLHSNLIIYNIETKYSLSKENSVRIGQNGPRKAGRATAQQETQGKSQRITD